VLAVREKPGESLDRCDEVTALAVVTSAFAKDPVERWLYPHEATYHREFPRFVRALGGRALDAGTAWCSPSQDAVSLWLPPGSTPDEELVVEVLVSSVAEDKHAEMFDCLTQMGDAHPTEPHWYLPWLAVGASKQGQGVGAELLRRTLAVVDAAHQPAYLETPNPRTVPLYESHGFRVVGHTNTPTCPPLTFMYRHARSST
jgi:GNAT superfamily N-acetyltransferase